MATAIDTSLPTVASAATIKLSDPTRRFGDQVIVCNVTGTADISTITAERKGTIAILIFAGTKATSGVLAKSGGVGNILIAANFAYAPNSVLALVCDGTNWFGLALGAVGQP
jgi:hypothetical protein